MSADLPLSFPVFAIFGLPPGKSPIGAVHDPPYLEFGNTEDHVGVFAVPIFTHQDLAKSWCENNSRIEDAATRWLRLNSPQQFADYLDRLALPEHITHLVFDPHQDNGRSPRVMSLAYLRGKLRRRG